MRPKANWRRTIERVGRVSIGEYRVTKRGAGAYSVHKLTMSGLPPGEIVGSAESHAGVHAVIELHKGRG